MADETTRLMIAQMNQKNLGLGVLLTFFFGGLGLLYSTIPGGITMAILEVIAWLLMFVGIGFVLVPLIHISSIIWSIVAINAHNRKLLEAATRA